MGPRTRIECQCAKQEESVQESTLIEPSLQESEAQSTTLPDSGSTSDNSSEFEHSEVNNPLWGVSEDPKIDTMSYPYPRYNDDADAETHVRAFLTTWLT